MTKREEDGQDFPQDSPQENKIKAIYIDNNNLLFVKTVTIIWNKKPNRNNFGASYFLYI